MQICIFGDRRAQLPSGWTKETVVTVFGDSTLDASAEPGPNPSVTVIGIFGETTVRVPSGSNVAEGGFTLFGDQEVRVDGGGAGTIRVNAFGLFGDLKVVGTQA